MPRIINPHPSRRAAHADSAAAGYHYHARAAAGRPTVGSHIA